MFCLQVVLKKQTQEGMEVMQVFRVYCDISRGVRGGAGMTLHSGVRVVNSCGVWLTVGVKQKWSAQGSRKQAASVALQEGKQQFDEEDDKPEATEVNRLLS